ncbi:helix-turn-helix domain-containing protein [Nocardia australiensis]|uniref:helix-turn-helix domain-containing protein n=1 Tax=Nocardia australiensis TaxID=2887191 RepID=UPI001D14E047|nr:AraC family transcriptional regulator [Nocardia australiensis]
MLFFYLDPGSTRARHIRDSMLEQSPTICVHHRGEFPILRYLRVSEGRDSLELRDRVLGATRRSTIDARIRTATITIRDHPARNCAAAELAAEAGLSTSRFLHLFSAHTGTSFRRYRLWARMVHAAAAISKGMDLTRAATEFGFASPSHFSDTFHALFGLTATTLLSTGVRIITEDS